MEMTEKFKFKLKNVNLNLKRLVTWMILILQTLCLIHCSSYNNHPSENSDAMSSILQCDGFKIITISPSSPPHQLICPITREWMVRPKQTNETENLRFDLTVLISVFLENTLVFKAYENCFHFRYNISLSFKLSQNTCWEVPVQSALLRSHYLSVIIPKSIIFLFI